MFRLSLFKSAGLSLVAVLLCAFSPLVRAQEFTGVVATVPGLKAKPQVTEKIDLTVITRPGGNTKLASELTPRDVKGATDIGRADAGMAMALELDLRRPKDQATSLDSFKQYTQNPDSPLYGKTLTPAVFAQEFGLAASDLDALTDWLKSEGFTVGNVDNGRLSISFTGTVAQVEATFHTEIHNYTGADGVQHFSNATLLEYPQALARVIGRVSGTSNFKPFSRKGFDGPVTDVASAGPKLTLAKSSKVPELKLEGEGLQDASFTASRYDMLVGDTLTLNARIGGANSPATGSLALTDNGKVLGVIAEISGCESYNGGLGHDCTFAYSSTQPGTHRLALAYSGDDRYRGEVQQVIISNAGNGASYTVITPNTNFNSATSTAADYYTVTSWAGIAQLTGSVLVSDSIGFTIGGATYPATGSLTSTGTGTDEFNDTYSYNCTTSLATKTVSCAIYNAEAAFDSIVFFGESGPDEVSAAYSADANYGSSTGYTYEYVPEYVGTVNPTITSTYSPTSSTYGAATTEAAWVVTLTGVKNDGSPENGNYDSYIQLTGPVPTGNTVTSSVQLGTLSVGFLDPSQGVCSTYAACTITGPGTYTIPAVVTPGTYNLTFTYSGNSIANQSGGNGTGAYAPASTTVSFTELQQQPTATMTSPTAAAPVTQYEGALSAFTVTGTVAWTGVGAEPTPGNVTFTSSNAAGTFGAVTCTAANSPANVPTSPLTCSALFTPAAGDVTGTYSINLNFAADTNYLQAGSKAAGNYIIGGPATTVVLAVTPTYSGGSTSAGVASTSIQATVTATKNNGSFTGTVTFTKTYTGGTVTFGTYSVTGLTSTTAIATLPLTTSTTGITAGLDSFTAKYTDVGNYGTSPVSNTLPIYIDGVLLTTSGSHDFSSLIDYSTAYPNVEGTVDGTKLTYGVSVFNFTGAVVSLPYAFTPVSSSVAFTYQTNCPTAPATLANNATCEYLYAYDPPGGDGCTPGTTCTKDSSGYYQGTFESTDWALTVPNGTLVGLGDPQFDRSGPATASGVLEGKALLPAGSLSISPTTTLAAPYTFPTMAPNEVSATETFLVTNPNATETAFTYTAPVSAAFHATNNCVSPLAPGATCNVQVYASDATAATYTGNFVLTPNGGTAVTTYLKEVVTAATGLTLTTNAHNFGNVQTGTSSTFGLTITNNSTTTAANLTFSNTAGTGYTLSTSGCANPLPKSSSCQVQVTFAPATGATTGTQVTDTLTVKSTTFPILPGGTGTAGAYQDIVTFTGTPVNTGELTATSVAHNFGTVTVGSSASNYGVELTNSTSSAVTLSFSGLTNTAAGFGLVGNNCPASLAANASCEMIFKFDPTGSGLVTGTYPITSSATLYSGGSAVSPEQITLTGTGQE